MQPMGSNRFWAGLHPEILLHQVRPIYKSKLDIRLLLSIDHIVLLPDQMDPTPVKIGVEPSLQIPIALVKWLCRVMQSQRLCLFVRLFPGLNSGLL